MSDVLLVADAVSKAFPARGRVPTAAVVEASLRIRRGEVVAIGGPSGGGKTTLLSLLAAVERPTSGRVLFDGEDLGALSAAALARVRRRVGIVFQGAPVLRRLSAWENVAAPLVPRGVPARERRARAAALLERVGLADRLDADAETLSAGESARLGLARASIADPDLVVADEPTAHLDPASAATVVAVLLAAAARGAAVGVATHAPARWGAAAARLAMAAGRLSPVSGGESERT